MKLKVPNNNICETEYKQEAKQACITETKAHVKTCQYKSIHNIQMTCPYTKSMKVQSRHKPPCSPYLYSPYLSPPLATKHQKGRLELRTSPGLEESKPSTSWALSRSGRRRCNQMVEMEGMWRHYESCIEVKQNREYGVSLWCFYKR
jgi:hypothetical protein